jgi:hypothetical protein
VKRAVLPGIAGGVLGIVTLGVYVAIIVAEANDSFADVAPWAGAMLGASVGAIAGSWFLPRRLGRLLLRVAAVVFLIVGVVAIFSIGVLLLVAGVLCLMTSEQSASGPAQS